MRTRLMRSKVTLLFMTCAVILLVFPAMASAQSAPTIQSDKGDYAPGELVTLTGSGWAAGETVNINVNDDAGQTWSRNVNVVADSSGNISDSFNLPSHFVATYSVTASGASGTATTSFTDANVRLKLDGQAGPVSISWEKFNGNATCTGMPNTTNSDNVSSSGFTNLTGVDAGQSIRITAPVVNNHKVTSWSGAISSTANPVCVAGSTSVQDITANYSRITSTALSSNDTTTTYGDDVTFTATVTAAAGNPNGNGTVDFKDGSTVICNDVALSGNTATCQTSSLGAGDHSITAEYSGTTGTAPRLAASTSSALTQSVAKAPTTTTVTCPASVTYTGSPLTPCSATVTGAGGLNLSPMPNYTNNTGPGQATASYTYEESANHLSSSDSETFQITQPCEWSRILQPVNQVSSSTAAGMSAYKQGSRGVVPVKFQLSCNGNLVDTAAEAADIGDVTRRLQIVNPGDNTLGNDVVDSLLTTPASTTNLFRFDDSSDQYIYNLGVKDLATGVYGLTVSGGGDTQLEYFKIYK